MERWHLPSIDASGKREPRVLFSRPECRAVLLDLQEGEEMRDHRVHERAIVEVVSGRLEVTVDGDSVECDAGTLLTFEPGETRSVRAL
ncbi:MAG: cupin domain-containing protein, partial [Actinobacteria bacterium]|nr:cupin domain-containing protein [Actinomycetota bacterium]